MEMGMEKADDEHFMLLAVEKAKEGLQQGQTPFGACIVKDSQIIACEHNTVWQTNDITAHAEVNAIRQACLKTGGIDLSGCTIYSTCEPCPMCFSACHWAKISRIVYGANIADAQNAGFSELTLSNSQMKEIGQSPIEITAGLLREETIELFEIWSRKEDKKLY